MCVCVFSCWLLSLGDMLFSEGRQRDSGSMGGEEVTSEKSGVRGS